MWVRRWILLGLCWLTALAPLPVQARSRPDRATVRSEKAKKSKPSGKSRAGKGRRGKSRARPTTGWCRERRDRARFRDTVATFAARNHISVQTFRQLNGLDLGPNDRLKHRRRYVSARGMAGERLVGGQSMGPTTADYIVISPARAWGQPFVVDLLRQAAHRVQSRYPAGHRIVFEDLSLPQGGCMPPHREHRGGLEVDAGLYHRGIQPRRLVRATAANLDAARTWLFLHSLVSSGRIRRIILDKRVQVLLWREARRQGWSAAKLATILQHPGRNRGAVITHGAGHDNHAHIAFRCPAGGCKLPADPLPEEPLPDGEALPDGEPLPEDVTLADDPSAATAIP